MCVQRLATPGAEVVHRLLNTLKRPHDMESSQPHTCAHAHACATQTHTETESHANASPSLSPTRTLSLCCCQIKAWKAGHKGNCVAAARADTRTAPKPTADQMRVVKMLEQLAGAANWRGVAAQEGAARAVAAAVRTSMPSIASIVYCILGIAYESLGDVSKAIEYHTQDLSIAKEVAGRTRTSASRTSRRGALQRPLRPPSLASALVTLIKRQDAPTGSDGTVGTASDL